jgi:hypothetical protein
MSNVGAEVTRKALVKTNVENFQKLALKTLFGEKQLALLHINSQCNSLDEDFTRIGIVQISNEGKLHFIHRTFAEFYVADFFVKERTNKSNISKEILDFLLKKIFLKEEYRVIRAFIDGLLSRAEPSTEVIKQCGNQTHALWKDGQLTLHTAAGEVNANIIGFLLDSLEKRGHTLTLVELLLDQNYVRNTAWHVAAQRGQIEVLKSLWEWAKKVLTNDELNNMFLAKDEYQMTTWKMVAEKGQIEVLHKLYEWAKKLLTKDELNNMFLAKDEYEKTA